MESNIFFLKKKQYLKLIDKINYMIETYKTLRELDINEDYSMYINFYDRQKIDIYNKINECNKNLHKLCNHQFVEDVIDYGLDSSQYIKYCILCECQEN